MISRDPQCTDIRFSFRSIEWSGVGEGLMSELFIVHEKFIE